MGLGILMAIWVRKLKDDEIYGFKYKLVKFWGLGINVKTEWNWIGLMTHFCQVKPKVLKNEHLDLE